MRRHARTGAGAARGRVRRSDVRIRAVIDIEKSSLRAFEQDLFPFLQRAMQSDDGVGNERPQLFTCLEINRRSPARRLIGFAPSACRMLLFSRILALQLFRE